MELCEQSIDILSGVKLLFFEILISLLWTTQMNRYVSLGCLILLILVESWKSWVWFFIMVQDTTTAPTDPTERTVWTFGQPATIELTQ